MTPSHPIVFLIDVDNTRRCRAAIQQDLRDHLDTAFPPADVTMERIDGLLQVDLPRLRLNPLIPASSLE
jgi:hypothetical protein